jgi:diguanylate cyclase (GGDEF)-like protein/PAS domain S-box-containing protein
MISSYTISLVLLSIGIAFFASYTAFDLASRVIHSSGRAMKYWLLGGSLSLGVGIWAMHFIGMLAFHLPIPLGYDISMTLVSIVPAIAASAIALWAIRRGDLGGAALLACAIVMGAGISAMHYTGMAALRMQPPIQYDPMLVGLSVAIAVVASLAALKIILVLDLYRASARVTLLKLGSAAVMAVAIAGMHYTGMAAAKFSPDSMCLSSSQGLGGEWMALLIAAGSVMMLLITLLVSIFDRRRKLTEQALASESDKNRMLLRAASDGIHIIDSECNIVQMSDSFCNMLGYTPEEMLTMKLSDFDAKWPLEVLKQRIGNFLVQGEPAVFETQHRHRDGHVIDVEINVVRVKMDGKHYMYASSRDITQRKLTEESLRLSAKVFEGSADAILISDANNRILTVNKAFTVMTGYSAEEVSGKNPNLLASGWHDRAFYQDMWDTLNREFHWEGEIHDQRKDGTVYVKQMSIDVLRDEQGKPTHYIAISKDITERMAAEQKIHTLAYYDVLTGLPNRTLMHDRLVQMLAVAHRDQQKVAVMFIDLDRFKYVNDSLGHLVGDKLLQAVAQQLLECVREGDTVSRIGGDEFVILLRETDPEGATHVATKLLEVLSLPYNVEDVQIPTHASIGISIYPDNAQDIDALLKSADVAMYRAKDEGRNNFQFYTAEMNFRAQHLFSMEKDLNLALERKEFSLHYQPVVDLLSGTICGAEALLRWNHPERGDICPTEFIPVAEETGQILPIGAWVLHTACIQLSAWRRQGLPAFSVAVNLSIRQLRQANLAQLVRTVLEENQLCPEDLDLELTEGIMMADTEIAMMFLTQMHELGVRLSIDDFGTGYSSLSYLKKLPVHKLKIDQSFVRDIVIDENDAAIASSIITLGHQFNLRVVAEGAETREQVEFLRVRGCDEIQGYYYCHPLPADEFAQFVQDHPSLV